MLGRRRWDRSRGGLLVVEELVVAKGGMRFSISHIHDLIRQCGSNSEIDSAGTNCIRPIVRNFVQLYFYA